MREEWEEGERVKERRRTRVERRTGGRGGEREKELGRG